MQCNRVCSGFAKYLVTASDAENVIQEVLDDVLSNPGRDLYHLLQHIQTTAAWSDDSRLLDLHSRAITKLKSAPKPLPDPRQPSSPLSYLPQEIWDIVGQYIDAGATQQLKATSRAGKLLAQRILINDPERLNRWFSQHMVKRDGESYFNDFLASCAESFYLNRPLHLTINKKCRRQFPEIEQDIEALQAKFPVHTLTIENSEITGEDFRKLMESLPSLKHLKVKNCWCIKQEDFQSAKYSEFLEEVTIQSAYIDDNSFHALCKRCPLIKRIMLGNCTITHRGAFTAPVGKFLEKFIFDRSHRTRKTITLDPGIDPNTLQELHDQVRAGTLPNALGLYHLARDCAMKRGQSKQVRPLLDEACRISPKFTPALFERAQWAYYVNHDMAQVKSDLEVIVTVDHPDYNIESRYFDTTFLKALLTGDASDAELQRKLYKRMLDAKSDNPIALFNYALLHIMQGRPKEAKAHFAKYLEHLSSSDYVGINQEYVRPVAKMLSLVLEDDQLRKKYDGKLRIVFEGLKRNHPDCPEVQEMYEQFLQKAPSCLP